MTKHVRDLLKGVDVSKHKMFVLGAVGEEPGRTKAMKTPFVNSLVRTPVIVEGLMYGMSGFAEALRNVAYSLHGAGVNVLTQPSDSKNSDNVDITLTKKGAFIEERSTHSFINNPPKIRLQMTIPMGIKRQNLNEYNIAYVMFETLDMPRMYVDHLKKECDEIWVPSKFNRDGFLRAGWKKPIFVMPLGVDTDQFTPDVEPLHKFSQYTFLSIMGWSERKGVSVLIEAFCRAFTKKDNVILRIKGGWYDEYKANQEVKHICSGFKNPPHIYVDFHIYTNEEMPRLYKSADAFVLPSRGEGWGLNYTEAMSMALPTIGTDATSMKDFMNPKNSYLIPITGWQTEPRCDWVCTEYVGGLFADPDVNALADILKYVYWNQELAKSHGINARIDMIRRYQWSDAGERYLDRLTEISNEL